MNQILLILGNDNWMRTSGLMISVIVYHTLFYALGTSDEVMDPLTIINYYIMIGLLLIVLSWMAYFLDK